MQRTIKSFVLRAGRLSPRQALGLATHFPKIELHLSDKPWDFKAIFARDAKTIVEIGFGMGASLFEMASQHPESNYIGIEVHRAGVGSLAADVADAGLSNVRVAMQDAVLVMREAIPDESLDGIQIFFPDPWPKKRHHKRRLIQADLVHLLSRKLKPGAYLHCATDWEDYALHIAAILSAEPLLKNKNATGDFVPRPDYRPMTKFEKRGLLLGHGVWDLVYFKR